MVNLIRRDPLRSFVAWPKWMDEFEDTSVAQRGLKIHETDKNIIAEAVVAGVPAKDVDVHIEDGVLTIKAEKIEKEDLPVGRQGKKGEYKSSSYQYYYTVALSGGQWDKADAEIEDGVLEVTIPKAEAARPRSISVKTRGG